MSLLLLAAFGLRLLYCAAKTGLGQTLGPDYREYIIVATRLLSEGVFASPLSPVDDPSIPSALLPPVYACVTAGVYAVLGVEAIAATTTLQLLNAIAMTLVVWVVFITVRRMATPAAAWLAAILAAVNPLLCGFTYLIWDANLFALGVAITVWLAATLARRQHGSLAHFAFGLWLGLLALLNPALTIAYPFLVLWSIGPRGDSEDGERLKHTISVKKKAPPWRMIGITVMGWLLAIAPWTIRHHHVFGRWMYVRGGFQEELWLGVSPQADTEMRDVFRKHFPLKNYALQHKVASMGEMAYFDECGQLARQAIVADPWRYARLVYRRAMDYWFGTIYTNYPNAFVGLPKTPARLLLTTFLAGEVVLIVVLLLVVRPLRPGLLWLAATAVSFSIVYCLTHVRLRFRVPIEPVLAVMLPILLTDALQTIRRRFTSFQVTTRSVA